MEFEFKNPFTQLIGVFWGGSRINFQILFFNNELNFALMVACHSLASFISKVSYRVFLACNKINDILASCFF